MEKTRRTYHEEQGVAVGDGEAEAAVEEKDGGAYPSGDALQHAHAHWAVWWREKGRGDESHTLCHSITGRERERETGRKMHQDKKLPREFSPSTLKSLELP